MKIRFTQLGFFVLTFLAVAQLQAQVNGLRIDAPSEIAGQYRASLAGFGQQLATDLTATATFANDGEGVITDACDGTITNVTGKIAFIDRGDCQFGTKALAAENAGAVAVIICNNISGSLTPTPGDDGDQVTIPVFGMTLADCSIIRTVADTSDIEATFITADCISPSYGSEVFWGNEPGQGDFDDGLNGWVIACEGDSCFGWTNDAAGVLSNGSFAGGVAVTTGSDCNGFVVMDSDFLDNTGNQAFGTGICPADCIGSLISPTIDLTAYSDIEGIYIEFDQQTRQFSSTYELILSNDGGITWPDTLVVNGSLEQNSAHIANTVKLPARGYQDAASITMQFRYTGNYYYWAIDDVRLVNELSANMELREDFFAVSPSYRTPLSQATEIPFLIDIENVGNLDAENVTVSVSILDETGTEVFSAINDKYATQPGGVFLNENSYFAETFTPTALGLYQGTYSIATDTEESDFTNNEVTFTFEVTEDILSPMASQDAFTEPIESIFTGSRFIDDTDDFYVSNYATGYIFHAPNGAGHVMNNVRFGLLAPESTTTANIDVYLFRWAYTDEDNSGAFVVDPSLTELIGVNTKPILVFGDIVRVGTEQATDIRNIDIAMSSAGPDGAPILDANNDPIRLELNDNSTYVLVIACRSNEGAPLELLGFDPETDLSTRSFLHGATNLALDSLGRNQIFGGFLEDITPTTGPAEIKDLIINNDLMGQGDTGNFGVLYDFRTLFVEMTIQDRTVGTEDIISTQPIDVYPNPATDKIFVDLDLDVNSKVVNVELIDAKGQLVLTQNFNNIGKDKLEINTSNLPSGFYNVNVRTEAGLTSSKIMIQK